MHTYFWLDFPYDIFSENQAVTVYRPMIDEDRGGGISKKSVFGS